MKTAMFLNKVEATLFESVPGVMNFSDIADL